MAKKWILGAIKHKGALHAELHIAKGKKIPKAKLEKAAKSKGILGKRARLAITLEGFTKAHEPRDGKHHLTRKPHPKKHKI